MIEGLLSWAAALWLLHPYTTWAFVLGLLVGGVATKTLSPLLRFLTGGLKGPGS
jgi:ABC-type uncharacterized transport system permease subunit